MDERQGDQRVTAFKSSIMLLSGRCVEALRSHNDRNEERLDKAEQARGLPASSRRRGALQAAATLTPCSAERALDAASPEIPELAPHAIGAA